MKNQLSLIAVLILLLMGVFYSPIPARAISYDGPLPAGGKVSCCNEVCGTDNQCFYRCMHDPGTCPDQ
jgi:hypothetical protein